MKFLIYSGIVTIVFFISLPIALIINWRTG